MNAKIAHNFYAWLIENEYRNTEDFKKDINEMVEDFEAMKEACPRMFNLLRDISDR